MNLQKTANVCEKGKLYGEKIITFKSLPNFSKKVSLCSLTFGKKFVLSKTAKVQQKGKPIAYSLDIW